MPKLICANMSFSLSLLHSERPKLYGVLVFLSAIGLNSEILIPQIMFYNDFSVNSPVLEFGQAHLRYQGLKKTVGKTTESELGL